MTANAYAFLQRYRDRVLCFNDDIQGTAAVILAGVMAAIRVTGGALKDQTIVFLGAGSAATGIADLIAATIEAGGVPREEARRNIWLVDSKGLVVESRLESLAAHKKPYAHDHEPMDFAAALDALAPNMLIGATGRPGTFTREIIGKMAATNERPVIFALSNPTSKAECTAEQAYAFSEGRALFASGSPFAPVELGGKIHITGQGNNAYIFPGVGLGAIACGATRVTDDMFLASAEALANHVTESCLESGSLYPPLTRIRDVSVQIAVAVAQRAYDSGLATVPRPDDLEAHIRRKIYRVAYDEMA